MLAEKFKLPARYGNSTGERSACLEYIELVAEHKPTVDLGKGFPDFHAPEHVQQALADITTGANPCLNQYTRGFGHPPLVKSLSKLYSRLVGREIDPFNEIVVTTGAYEALYSSILGNVDIGDEVIVIEPFFDCYYFMIKTAGGVPRYIALKPNKTEGNLSSAHWVLDKQQLTSLFTEKTKMIILNTPNSPLGKVFTQGELEVIADLCKKHNVLCLSDEVYEWIVYQPNKHVRLATLPGMWQRTITVGSAGKTFSVTGWKIGWAYGPAALMRNVQAVHQNSCCTPVQEAVHRALEFEMARIDSLDCYFVSLARDLTEKRDKLLKSLRENGFKPTTPEGSYFIVADWTDLESKIELSTVSNNFKDYTFTQKFAEDAGVLAIPATVFYSAEHKHLGEKCARFCFIKKDESLALTDKLLKEWTAKQIGSQKLLSIREM